MKCRVLNKLIEIKRTLRLRLRFRQVRAMTMLCLARKYWHGESSSEPLISVVINTWNRGKLLTERTLPSVLTQTYQNFEIVIVGDGCTDDTEERVRAMRDPRIRYLNMPKHGDYPQDPLDRWRMAGVLASNKAMDLARGEWLAYIDDDDVYLPDRLEATLGHALATKAEFVYGIGEQEIQPGIWHKVGSWPPKTGSVCHSAVLYSAMLRVFKYDPEAWKRNLPGDGDRWERMYGAGVKMSFLDRVVCRAPLRPGETLLQGLMVLTDYRRQSYMEAVLSNSYKTED